jgi:aspartate/methionine/tyrosine aminotransferase
MPNLTEIEQRAIDAPVNLADGHPRQGPTATQSAILERLPQLFAEARSESLEELEPRAQRAFLAALGQEAAPVEVGRVLNLYSSSVATMVLARYLQRHRHRVALIHPTFDNIADLLRDHVVLTPVREGALAEGDFMAAVPHFATCLFLTTPNNPTGWWLPERRLAELAAWAAGAGLLLCFDTSFRGFDTRSQFDMYRVLESAGVDYVVIEDTGKLWPVSELKLGFVAMSTRLEGELKHLVSDVLLSVSPLVLRLVEELALDTARGGDGELHELVAANRRRARAAAEELGFGLPDSDARVSVCRLRFASSDEASAVRRGLERRGVHVLPCRQFHWARPAEGGTDLRIALARDSEVVDDALERLRAAVTETRRPVLMRR